MHILHSSGCVYRENKIRPGREPEVGSQESGSRYPGGGKVLDSGGGDDLWSEVVLRAKIDKEVIDRSGVRSIMDSEFTTRVHTVQTIFQTLPNAAMLIPTRKCLGA
jgi:hypothetical protein